MSAFFVAINRSGIPFSEPCAARMMQQIKVFGHDAERLVVCDHYALGYQARWSVPEEVDEVQPLYDAQSQQWFVFDGRVDNRAALIAALNDPQLTQRSDGQLLFRFCQQFGESRLNDVIGSFVFVLFDVRRNQVIAARDPMGGRYLCHALTDEHLLFATYEMAIVAHGSVNYHLNQEKVARTVVSELESVPSSTIDGVIPLKPGECVTTTTQNIRFQRFYKAPKSSVGKPLSDAEYAREFRRLLIQAVQRRMRSVGKVGSLLSGGLDSIPVTIAAQGLVSEPIYAFSWTFDDYPDVDERCYSEPICRQFGIQQVPITCDHTWPQLDASTLTNPVFPFGIPYSEWQQAAFQEAKAVGVKTILTGIHGDLLYGHFHTLLFELAAAGRLSDAWSELRRIWRAVPNKWSVVKYYLLLPLPGMERFVAWRARRKNHQNPILQSSVAASIKHRRHWLAAESREARRSQQWQVVFDGFAGEDAALGRYLEAKYGIDRRYPFRDRDLCEFMMSVPADQLYYKGIKRPIVKRAFAPELSAELLARNNKTSFDSVIRDGILSDTENHKWFARPAPEWSKYVKQCNFNELDHDNVDVLTLKWRCGYYEYWKSVCYNPIFCELVQSDKNA
ncbi:asparagine synthase-related protein [Arenicella xantha]|uniref:asparagine synthase (glutamine-hydrolyzing) n=1 Tax=Arenicella xantha TaxID=644221 RepID=A0A395JGP7_9GAMM|nr:asparagine synthase-related protein [Arenicella xantha]RBP49086.1 asparagine synthase (glutamine-hydrolysing) [Arenicella xantha]